MGEPNNRVRKERNLPYQDPRNVFALALALVACDTDPAHTARLNELRVSNPGVVEAARAIAEHKWEDSVRKRGESVALLIKLLRSGVTPETLGSTPTPDPSQHAGAGGECDDYDYYDYYDYDYGGDPYDGYEEAPPKPPSESRPVTQQKASTHHSKRHILDAASIQAMFQHKRTECAMALFHTMRRPCSEHGANPSCSCPPVPVWCADGAEVVCSPGALVWVPGRNSFLCAAHDWAVHSRCPSPQERIALLRYESHNYDVHPASSLRTDGDAAAASSSSSSSTSSSSSSSSSAAHDGGGAARFSSRGAHGGVEAATSSSLFFDVEGGTDEDTSFHADRAPRTAGSLSPRAGGAAGAGSSSSLPPGNEEVSARSTPLLGVLYTLKPSTFIKRSDLVDAQSRAVSERDLVHDVVLAKELQLPLDCTCNICGSLHARAEKWEKNGGGVMTVLAGAGVSYCVGTVTQVKCLVCGVDRFVKGEMPASITPAVNKRPGFGILTKAVQTSQEQSLASLRKTASQETKNFFQKRGATQLPSTAIRDLLANSRAWSSLVLPVLHGYDTPCLVCAEECRHFYIDGCAKASRLKTGKDNSEASFGIADVWINSEIIRAARAAFAEDQAALSSKLTLGDITASTRFGKLRGYWGRHTPS